MNTEWQHLDEADMTQDTHNWMVDILGCAGFGYQKVDRLLKRPEFRRVYQSGRKVANGYFTIQYRIRLLSKASTTPKLGISVSRRVGNAVVRNRVKRLVREFFRCHRDLLPGPIDLNVIARADAAMQSRHRLRVSLETLFMKIRARESFQSID